ncbi:hypothetical protein TNCV_2820211 [Trichonephila clavipes]|nr:hypothetical protein TNCV_2820211 [Trichonephila clavipes]
MAQEPNLAKLRQTLVKIRMGMQLLKWSGREKKKRRNVMTRKRVENREGSLGYPGFVRPVFTKDNKPLGKRKILLGYLGIVTPVLTERR